MDILGRVTGDALHGQSQSRRLFLGVTRLASDRPVRPCESEMRLRIVVEGEIRPAFCRMAFVARRSKPALVHRVGMTTLTSGRRLLVDRRFVTRGTCDILVQSAQGKARSRVIELDAGPPTLGRMTLIATRPK